MNHRPFLDLGLFTGVESDRRNSLVCPDLSSAVVEAALVTPPSCRKMILHISQEVIKIQ